MNKIKVKNWLIFSVILVIFLVFEVIFTFFIDFSDLSMIDTVLMLFTKYFVLTTFFVAYYYDYFKEKWQDFKKNFKKYFSLSFKYWFTGFLIMYFANIIISRFISGVGKNEESVQNLIGSLPFISLIITSVFAPFIEEMVFRKNLQDCFNNKTLYMVTSGFLFGFVHVIGASNPLEYLLIISYGAVGLFFAKTVNETDNIYCTIMMHAIHNFTLTMLSIMVSL